MEFNCLNSLLSLFLIQGYEKWGFFSSLNKRQALIFSFSKNFFFMMLKQSVCSHIKHIYTLLHKRKIAGSKISVGRYQNSWLRDIHNWFGCTSTETFRAADSRTTLTFLIIMVHWYTELQEYAMSVYVWSSFTLISAVHIVTAGNQTADNKSNSIVYVTASLNILNSFYY